MKKILILILTIVVLFMTGCGTKKNTTYQEITYNILNQKLESKDSFVLVIGKTGCSACAKYKTTMESVIKDYNATVYYIDLAKLSDEDNAKVYSKYVITATPTTIFFKDGVETSTYDRIVGSTSYSKIVENLKKHGIIGE